MRIYSCFNYQFPAKPSALPRLSWAINTDGQGWLHLAHNLDPALLLPAGAPSSRGANLIFHLCILLTPAHMKQGQWKTLRPCSSSSCHKLTRSQLGPRKHKTNGRWLIHPGWGRRQVVSLKYNSTPWRSRGGLESPWECYPPPPASKFRHPQEPQLVKFTFQLITNIVTTLLFMPNRTHAVGYEPTRDDDHLLHIAPGRKYFSLKQLTVGSWKDYFKCLLFKKQTNKHVA